MKLTGIKFGLLCLLACIALACLGGAAKAEEKILRIGTSGEYYPMTFVEDGKPLGLEIDVWNEIGKRIGYHVEYKYSNFSGLFGMLDAGRIDTVANNISISPTRQEKYLFSIPYVNENLRLIVAKDASVNSLSDLKGKKVAANVGTADLQILTDAIKKLGLEKDIEVVAYDNNAALRDVDLGRIGGAVDSEAHTATMIVKSGLKLKLVGAPLASSPIGYPFVKNDRNKELLPKINEALEAMKKDGTLAKICEKWVGDDISYK